AKDAVDPWAVELPSKASEAAIVQPHVSGVIKQHPSLSGAALRLFDTHAKVSYLGRSPDIVIGPIRGGDHLPCKNKTNVQAHPQPFYIVAIGDVKGRRTEEEFTLKEQGHMASFLVDLLRVRPDRRLAVGFL